jgi:sugar (pentulose or hexulose) kinase
MLMHLAIDLGSTFLKAAVFMGGAPIRRHAVRLRYEHPSSDGVELPCERFDQAIAELIAGLAMPSRPAAIAITSQAQTFAVARADGTMRTPFISWQDTRAVSIAAELMGESQYRDFALHSSFCTLHPQQMLCQAVRLARLRQVGPDDHLLPLPSRLMQLLGCAACLDANLAAMTGMWSLRDGCWWGPALTSIGIGPDQLPLVVPPGSAAIRTGSSAITYGIEPGIPVVLAGNDQTAGAYAAGIRQGGILLGLGTAQVAYRWRTEMPAPQAGLVRGHFPGGGAYQMAVDEIGGNAITWAAQRLGMSAADLLHRASQTPAGSRGVSFVARPGAGEGEWIDAAAAGAGDLGRSVVEHLADRMSALLHRLGGSERLLVSDAEDKAGWRDIMSCRMGRECIPVPSEPLLGAARMLEVIA